MQGATVLGTGVPFTVTPTATTTYMVVLTGECSTAPDTAYVTVSHPAPITPLLVPDDPDGCFPHAVTFANMSTGGTVSSLIVDYGDGTSETLSATSDIYHEYPTPGSYTVSTTVTSDIGCVYNATFPNMITVFNNPIAGFTIQPNPVSMFDPTVQLIDNSSPGTASWSWMIENGTPGGATTENVTATFPEGVASNYDVTLYIVDENGCEDSVVHTVQVINEVILYAPNAFTPDGDEHNNTWFVHIEGVDMTQFELRLYNRWGELIWENYDPEGAWDGTYNGSLVQEGTYNWVIEVKDVLTDERYEFMGSFTVLY
jgi:gliding motility-associated-like protein